MALLTGLAKRAQSRSAATRMGQAPLLLRTAARDRAQAPPSTVGSQSSSIQFTMTSLHTYQGRSPSCTLSTRPKVHGTEMKQPSHREALMIRSSAAPPSPSQRLTLSRRTAACPKQSTATAPTAWELGLLVALWVRDPPAHFLPAPRSFLRRRL